MTRLVLASASPGRLRVLRQAGVDPVVVVSGVDEDAVIAALGPNTAPADVTTALATAKAQRAVDLLEPAVTADCVVIGCDSMLEADGRLVGKPGSAGVARDQWNSMGGRCGRLHTGHCVLRLNGGAVTASEAESATTTVHFASPSAADVDAYIASGEPLQVAGGFTIDGLGGWFVNRIEGDPSNVVGLSLPLTRQLLQRIGIPVSALWATRGS
jgi:septum formation protein